MRAVVAAASIATLALALAVPTARSAPTQSESTFVGVAISSFPTDYSDLPMLYPEIFKKRNLRLGVLNTAGGSDVIRTLLAGSQNIHFGISAVSAAVSAIKAGAPIEIIAGLGDTTINYYWVAKADSSISSLQDLSGKSVGITGPGSGTQTLLDICLAKAGISGVREVATGGIGPGLTALSAGGLAVVPIVEPSLSANPSPYKVIFNGTDCAKRFQGSVLITTNDYAKQHPAIVRSFLNGTKLAIAAIAKNPSNAATRWATALHLNSASAVRPFIKKVLNARGWNLQVDVPGFNTAISAFGTLKISGPIDWTSIIDQRFLPKGIAKSNLAKLAQP